MEKVSIVTHILFVVSTMFVLYQLCKAARWSKTVLRILLMWTFILSILGMADFYKDGYEMPPRLLFLVGPGAVMIIVLFATRRGRSFLDSVNMKDLTLLQSVRLPVELVLYQLYIASLVPGLMTFRGYNFDILTGVSAPVIACIAFKHPVNRTGLLIWNFAGLLLLLTIVIIAILSAATPFQQLAFEQPNIGVTYFPYVWLPGIIVPAALFSHLTCVRRLLLARHTLAHAAALR